MESKPKTTENLVEALGEKIYQRIKELSEVEEFMIVNRVATKDFLKVFKESSLDYRDDVILCERLYTKNACQNDKKTVYAASDEEIKIYNEYQEFAASLSNVKFLFDKTPDELQQDADKLKAFQEKLKGIKLEESSVDTMVYKTPFNDEGYLVSALKEINDETLLLLCKNMAVFIISYFNCMHLSVNSEYQICIFSVRADDYTDIVAKVSYE